MQYWIFSGSIYRNLLHILAGNSEIRYNFSKKILVSIEMGDFTVLEGFIN